MFMAEDWLAIEDDGFSIDSKQNLGRNIPMKVVNAACILLLWVLVSVFGHWN